TGGLASTRTKQDDPLRPKIGETLDHALELGVDERRMFTRLDVPLDFEHLSNLRSRYAERQAYATDRRVASNSSCSSRTSFFSPSRAPREISLCGSMRLSKRSASSKAFLRSPSPAVRAAGWRTGPRKASGSISRKRFKTSARL